ncbi:MAG: hypothetical protein R3244_06670 [Thermoanaerobaculia bacterium]|nr:hypothetical protein [Thermoanaerobaculia bacterium]
MKRFKYLALAALVAFGACDEGEDLVVDDPITGSVQVTVTAESAGVQGITVNLVGETSSSQTTPASGVVTFSDVPEGAYAVTISGIPSGYVFPETSKTATVTTEGQTVPVSFSGNVVRTASISGQVTANGEAVEGATIEINGPEGSETQQTGAAGTYQFTGLIAGSYTVTLQGADIGGIECVETTTNQELDPGEGAVANFSCGGQREPASVAIERITTQAGVAVDRTAVTNIIVIQVGVDEGGQNVSLVTVDLNGIEICSQELGGNPVSGPMAVEEEFEIDCVVNTAAVRSILGEPSSQFTEAGSGLPFEPIFLNGEMNIVAEAVTESDDDVDPTATAGITLVNPDLLALNVEVDNPEAPSVIIDSTTGLRWLSGSLTFTVYPIIFSAPFDPNNPAIARANFGFDSYVSDESTTHYTNDTDFRPDVGDDAVPATWQLNSTSPDPVNGSFTFTLSDAMLTGATNSDGVFQVGNGGGIDDIITGTIGAQNITIQTITSFGQFGPGVVCANISTTCTPTAGTVSPNPLRVFYEGVLQSGTGAVNNVLRVDNQEPWANTVEIDPHPAASLFPGAVAGVPITTNGKSSVRGGWNFNGQRDGWVNHAYEFDSGMWANTMATDAPNMYATHPYFALPTGITASVTPLAGIGVDAAGLAYFAAESEDANSLNGLTITGMAGSAQRVRTANGDRLVETGADLPNDEGPGLDLLTPPNSNERDDISLVGVVPDLFANAGLTNVLEIGVDGHDPEFRNDVGASGTSPIYPTPDGSVYNTYGVLQASNPSQIDDGTLSCSGTPPSQVCTTDKTEGEFIGTITDAGNGFSGAAAVTMRDWENGCPSGTMSCAVEQNERNGITLQDPAILLPTAYLYWEWSIDGGNTFLNPAGAPIGAYDAIAGTPAANDGYRQQQPTAWDRAANSSSATATVEHIADKTFPIVGNVEMPTITMFVLGNTYNYFGENADVVDLKYTDFVIDYNTITSIQSYHDEVGDSGDPFAPGVDAYGNPYLSNGDDGGDPGAGDLPEAGNSLQLPMAQTTHTAFGSASILLGGDLAASAEFVGCVALFDDQGFPDNAFDGDAYYDAPSDPDYVHIPRGPRWRTWDHAYPYGLINTQYNTFTPSSVPQNSQTVCANGMDAYDIRAQLSPSANGPAWNFGIGVETGGSQLELSVSGQSGVFVPGIDITRVDLYYIDAEGRARILDLSGANWTGPFVEDVGTGSFGRTYTWTWNGTLPTNTVIPDVDGSGRWTEPYFFTYRVGNGTALMWDDSAN